MIWVWNVKPHLLHKKITVVWNAAPLSRIKKATAIGNINVTVWYFTLKQRLSRLTVKEIITLQAAHHKLPEV